MKGPAIPTTSPPLPDSSTPGSMAPGLGCSGSVHPTLSLLPTSSPSPRLTLEVPSYVTFLGLPNKVPQQGGLRQQEYILSKFWRPEVQNQSADRADFFFFFGFTHSVQKFLSKGWNPCHHRDLSLSNDNARSLTQCSTRELHELVFFSGGSKEPPQASLQLLVLLAILGLWLHHWISDSIALWPPSHCESPCVSVSRPPLPFSYADTIARFRAHWDPA